MEEMRCLKHLTDEGSELNALGVNSDSKTTWPQRPSVVLPVFASHGDARLFV